VAKQTSNNGPSQAASTKAVTFSRQSAQRIAKVVRTVEAGNRDQPGITFDHPQPGGIGGRAFRMATFTGSWSIDATKVVTFIHQTTTPNTTSVVNELISLPDAGTRNCAIAKEGTAWYLVNWQWDVRAAATAATLTTASLRFDTIPVGALATISTASFSVSITTCSTAT
jgi:hypothetical protein